MLPVSSHNILIVNPIFGYSHSKYICSLADTLADAGHSVTVFQHRHVEVKGVDKLLKNKKIEIINYLPEDYEEMLKTDPQTFPEFWDSQAMASSFLQSVFLPTMLTNEFKKESTRVLKDTKLHEELKSKKFDAVIAETFETSGFYLAYLIGVNPIALFSAVRFPVESVFGHRSNIGYVTQTGSVLAPDAGFWDRLNDIYTDFFEKRWCNGLLEKQHQIYSAAIGGNIPHFTELVGRSPIFITNANPYLDFAVPTTGNIVKVGGITTSKHKKIDPLPEEYEQILRERNSTVLVSFGSVVRSYQMPNSFKSGIIKMFESLPDITFIWKYEKHDAELQKRLPPNAYLKKWVPQPALLADKRLKVFVTHGGLGSTMEVAYAGKPALMVPLFGDQPHNANMLARHGGAVSYDKFELQNGEKLTKVMRDMVTSPKYKEHADELREVLNHQPIEPKEILLKSIDFAVRFPNFKSQIPQIAGAGIIAYYYLDVVSFLIVVFLFAAYILLKLSRRLVKKLAPRKAKNE